MAEYAIARPIPAKRAITIASALGSGVINGYVLKRSPVAGFITTLLSALGGTALSLFTKGLVAEIAEGFGAGAVGAFGLLMPLMTATSVRTIGATAPERLAEAQREAATLMRSPLGSVWPAPRAEEEFKGIRLV